MSPRRFVIIPDSDTELVEVGIHGMTKRGMKSTYKQVRAEQPPPEQSGQASRSRSKKKKQPERRQVAKTLPEVANIEDMETHVFVDAQEDNLPDFVPEEIQTRKTVRSYIFLRRSITNET